MMLLADIGLPMVCVSVPAMLVALIPITAVEAFVLRKFLRMDKKEAWGAALHVNVRSTLIGIPIAWAFLALAQVSSGGSTAWQPQTPLDGVAAVAFQSAWLAPREEEMGWMIPAASVALLIPFCIASIFIENWLLERRWKGAYREGPRFRAVALANLASYALLACVYLVMLYVGFRYRPAPVRQIPSERAVSPAPTRR